MIMLIANDSELTRNLIIKSRCLTDVSMLQYRRVILSKKQPVSGRFNMFKTPKFPKTLRISRILCKNRHFQPVQHVQHVQWITPLVLTEKPEIFSRANRKNLWPTEKLQILSRANWNDLRVNWKNWNFLAGQLKWPPGQLKNWKEFLAATETKN